jgi:hypothetical protein
VLENPTGPQSEGGAVMQTKMPINGELVDGGGKAIRALNPATGEEMIAHG